MAQAFSAPGGRGSMSIGQVIDSVRAEFPDVSVSKLRFLEAEGLLTPERTASGYRKFAPADVERLRYILAAQRDSYLPLRVIKTHLDAMARGLVPPTGAGELPRVPALEELPPGDEDGGDGGQLAPVPQLQISRAELLANSGLAAEQLDQLVGFGLVKPRPGSDFFDGDALVVAQTVARMATYGLEPRHMRAIKTAADREVGLIEQVVSPLSRRRNEAASARVAAIATELADLCVTLHAALMRISLRTGR